MKHYFTLLIALALCAGAHAQTAVLVLSDTTEHTITSSKTTFDLDKPCQRLTLNAKHTASTVTTNKSLMGNLTIEQNVNGTWETLYEDNPGIVTEGERGTIIKTKYEAAVDYESLSFSLDRHATQIRFSGSVLNEKQIKNLCAYMASYVEMRPATIDFGEMVVWSDPVSLPLYVEHCNVARLSLSTTNPDFALSSATVTNSGVAQYATDTFQVTFTPNIMGQHTATIVVTNGTQTDSIHCRAKVTKRTPVITWAVPETIQVGDTIDLPVSSDCSNAMALTTCTDAVEVLCGQIVARHPGEAMVEVLQLGDDDYWNNKQDSYTFTVVAAPEVPTSVAPGQATDAAPERYVLNGMVYVRTQDATYMVDGGRVQ